MSDTVSLKEHFDALRACDKELFSTLLAAQDKAVAVAEANSEKWRSNANEWRQAMNDKDKTTLSRFEAAAEFKGITDRLETLTARQDRNSGKSDGANWLWTILAGIAGIIATLWAVKH